MTSTNVRRVLWLCGFVSLWSIVASCFVSCQGDTTILLRLEGDVPGAQTIKLRVVNDMGALSETFTFPEAGKPLTLPGTIDFRVPASQGRLGVFVWAESSSGGVLAHARSFACFRLAANAQNKAALTLAPVAPAFSPNQVQDCKCNGDLDMCDPNAVAPTGGSGGSGGTGSGGSSGIGSGGASNTGGTSGFVTGGSGGSLAQDGGISDAGTAGMMGTGGNAPDAAVITPDAGPVVTNAVFSFDNVADWSSTETALMQDTAIKTQGTGSVGFTAPATTVYIRSRAFNTAEVPGATAKLGLSVYLEATTSSSANIQLWFECMSASVYNAYVQYKPLGGLAVGWNQVVFDLPPAVVNALKSPHADCKFWMQHEAAGKFRYDNLTFL